MTCWVCSRLVEGLYELYQSSSSAVMSNKIINVTGVHRFTRPASPKLSSSSCSTMHLIPCFNLNLIFVLLHLMNDHLSTVHQVSFANRHYLELQDRIQFTWLHLHSHTRHHVFQACKWSDSVKRTLQS